MTEERERAYSLSATSPPKLDQILAHVALSQMFKVFLEEDLCSEYIFFNEDAYEYEATTNGEDRKQKFDQMLSKYLSEGAPYEMNFPGYVRDSVFTHANEEHPPMDAFKDCLVEVNVTLSTECLPRFIKSRSYLAFLENKPDSLRTARSRKKLEDFFGEPIHGNLTKIELVVVLRKKGYERSARKRAMFQEKFQMAYEEALEEQRMKRRSSGGNGAFADDGTNPQMDSMLPLQWNWKTFTWTPSDT